MPNKWQLTLITPKLNIRRYVFAAWKKTLVGMEDYIRNELVPAMIYGGMGIHGIKQTNFYQYITSPDGLSQLGIEATEPPKLLDAYLKSFRVYIKGNILVLEFGNVYHLKAGTRHPANNTGQLKIDSWLTWILDGRTEPRGYVARKDIAKDAQKRIRLQDPLGGLMLRKGAMGKSLGTWRFPPQHQGYDKKWLNDNWKTIQRRIIRKMMIIFAKELKG